MTQNLHSIYNKGKDMFSGKCNKLLVKISSQLKKQIKKKQHISEFRPEISFIFGHAVLNTVMHVI